MKAWKIGLLVLISAGMMMCGATRDGAAAKPNSPSAVLRHRLAKVLGARDAVIIDAPDGQTLAAVHADRLLVPASILKILISLAALHHLGPSYRYPTEFFLSPHGSLKIKGYGDPLLVSENLAVIAAHLAQQIKTVDHLILDQTYFAQPVEIPGRRASVEPYDAPNGALCVNFNTVNFKRQGNQWVSAEPQTPLLSSVIPKIKASGLTSGRILLASNNAESVRYAGELFRYFLNQAGVRTQGDIVLGAVDPRVDKLLWRYQSDQELTRVIGDLLTYSNNFIANQLLLTMGARVYGPPATVKKGLRVLRGYYQSIPGIDPAHIAEASGLSRENRISARALMRLLKRFQPYHQLMRRQGRQWYKTGHLEGVRTRAGYLTAADGGLYRFVVMINTPGRTPDRVMRIIERELP